MMSFATALISLTVTVCALTCVTMAAEYLLPSGSLKSTVAVGAGILYLSALIEQITGIFIGGGV